MNDKIIKKYKDVLGYDNVEKHEEEDIISYSAEVYSANVLGVKAGTNGYHGGDAGHGGHSFIEIEDFGSTAMEVSVGDEKFYDIYDSNRSNAKVRIDVFGDAELSTLIDSLRFMADALEEASDYGKHKYGLSAYAVVVDHDGKCETLDTLTLESVIGGEEVIDEVVLMSKDDERHRVVVIANSEINAHKKAKWFVEYYLMQKKHLTVQEPCIEWEELISEEQFSKMPWFEFKLTTQKTRDALKKAYPLEYYKIMHEYNMQKIMGDVKTLNKRERVDLYMSMHNGTK